MHRILGLLFYMSASFQASAQVDSIVIMHYLTVDYPDSLQITYTDSFSTGIHVSQLKYDAAIGPVSRTFYNWSQGNLIDSTVERFVDTAWFYSKQRVNQFDANDSLILSMEYTFTFNGIDYDTGMTQLRIIRDTINHTINRITEYRSGNGWVTLNSFTEVYDSLRRLTYQLYEYPASLPSWDRTYSYLPNDSIDYYIYRQYQSGILSDSDSVTHIYYPNGLLEQEITFISWTDSSWRPNWMVSYTYDPIGNMLSLCNHVWIDSTIGWECLTDTISISYNSFSQQIRRSRVYCGGGGGSESYYFYDGYNRPDSIHLYQWPHSGNTNHFYWTFEYPLPVSVGDLKDESIYIYPNPTTDYLIVKSNDRISRIGIVDPSGRMVYEDRIHDYARVLDLSFLDPGIYTICIIKAEGRRVVRMFVKN